MKRLRKVECPLCKHEMELDEEFTTFDVSSFNIGTSYSDIKCIKVQRYNCYYGREPHPDIPEHHSFFQINRIMRKKDKKLIQKIKNNMELQL